MFTYLHFSAYLRKTRHYHANILPSAEHSSTRKKEEEKKKRKKKKGGWGVGGVGGVGAGGISCSSHFSSFFTV